MTGLLPNGQNDHKMRLFYNDLKDHFRVAIKRKTTNVFLRYLTADDKAKYGKCRDLLKAAIDGKSPLATSSMVIAELVWTLLSYYKVPKTDVIEKISLVIGTEAIDIPDREILAEAMVLYSRRNIDFIDVYNAVFMAHKGMHGIYSYDEDFDGVAGIERKEP